MSFLAFRTGLRYFDLGYASAMSYCLLIIVMIIVTLFFENCDRIAQMKPKQKAPSQVFDLLSIAVVAAMIFLSNLLGVLNESANPLDTFTVSGFGIPFNFDPTLTNWVDHGHREAEKLSTTVRSSLFLLPFWPWHWAFRSLCTGPFSLQNDFQQGSDYLVSLTACTPPVATVVPFY